MASNETNQKTQLTQLQVFSFNFGRTDQKGNNRGHHTKPGALILGNEFPEVGDTELVRHHHTAAADQRGYGGDDFTINVVKR